MKRFERKFGAGILATIPESAGVYRFFDDQGLVIYVGKARNLRKRLSQYSKARRGKMRKIVIAATKLEWELLDTELQALLHELTLIQSLSPKLNVAGKFSYLYPYLGLKPISHHEWAIAFSTKPHELPGYQWHGCFRSRTRSRAAFDGLCELLEFVGHPTPLTQQERDTIPAYTIVRIFRRIPEGISECIGPYLLGQSDALMHRFFEALLDLKSARAKAADLQVHFEALEEFWRTEAAPLARVIQKTQWQEYPVQQTDRDGVFLRAKDTQTDISVVE